MKFLDTRNVLFKESEFHLGGSELKVIKKGSLADSIKFEHTVPANMTFLEIGDD